METKTLTNGIAMNVGFQAKDLGIREEKPQVFDMPNDSALVTASEKATNNERVSSQDISRKDHKETNLADTILNSAKDKGFEETLKHLADGDFEEIEENQIIEILDTDQEIVENTHVETPVVSPEMQFYVEKVQILEEKVKDLWKKNEELSEKIQKMEDKDTQSLMSLSELIRIYEELVNVETDSKSKAGLLEILIDLLAEFIKTIIDPDEEKKEDAESQPEEQKPTFLEFARAYMESQKRIEKPAA